MPYLNKKITVHNKGCKNPNVKRLYIRDYDNKGKQKYIPYAVTCTNCDALVKEKSVIFNLPPKKRAQLLIDCSKIPANKKTRS